MIDPLALSLSALALSALIGCPHADLTGRDAAPMTAAAYARAVQDATREARRYDGVETALLLRAALDTPAFVDAREAQRAWLLLSTPDEARAALAAARQEIAAHHRLLVAASSDQDSRPALSFDHDPWRLRLLGSDGPCAPVNLTERRPTDLDRALYPWITQWNNVWDATFDRDCGGSPLRLQVAGPRASAELVWE